MDTIQSRALAKRIRHCALEMTSLEGAGHIGSILSLADIVAVLFSGALVHDASSPMSDTRDRLLVSKGHGSAAVYAALVEKGFLTGLGDFYHSKGTKKKGAFVRRFPGLEFSSASLGHGIGVAVGMAMAAKMDGKSHRVFVIVGNGECNEGSVWEAVMVAAHQGLSNLVVIVDDNQMQAMGFSKDILDMGDLAAKFGAFGAQVVQVDGHDHEQLFKAFAMRPDRPLVVVAKTVKGKGVSFIENNPRYHYESVPKSLLYKALDEVDR